MTPVTSRRPDAGRGRSPIYINMRFLTQPLSGMQRYAEELISALDNILVQAGAPPRAPLIGLVPPGKRRKRDWKHITVRQFGSLKGHAWEQVELAMAARNGTLVSLAGSGPLAHSRQVFAAHDANLAKNPHYFSPSYRALHGVLRPRLIRKAAELVTISNFSASELSTAYHVDKSRFHIIHDSAEHILSRHSDSSVLEKNGLTKKGYILSVGNLSPNKNIGLAIRAFKSLGISGMRFAVVGSSPKALAEVEIPSEPWLHMLGRISDGELRALYENAAAFVFPSVYEGFGVPPLEAMTLGCPVVSSDSSAMPEILGDAALFFKSGDERDCAARIEEAMHLSRNHACELRDKGLSRAGCYSWSKSAERLASLLDLQGSIR